MYLILDGLTRKFGEKTAVNHIDLTIRQGELITLLGPSGCGKTTLLKMIGGFLSPSAGRILLEGVDCTAVPPEERPVATVFQHYALFPHMTVQENVAYGLRYKAGCSRTEARQRTADMLALMHLTDIAAQSVTRISGGQQQRVALARALILSPKVLLLDEPLSNLDAQLRVRIRREIKELQSRLGITTLFVTHDQEEALSISDRVAVMNQGRLEQIGTPRALYAHPQNEFVANFVGRANLLPQGETLRIVRPENLLPIASGAGDYQGIVRQKQYMGSYTIYSVEAGDILLQVDVPNSRDRDWQLGETVFLKVAADTTDTEADSRSEPS